MSQNETAGGRAPPSHSVVDERQATSETYSPWTVVVDQGLHPTLGDAGHPGEPAAELLRALGIVPSVEGDARLTQRRQDKLAELRAALMDEP
jgi:hypothetical protein